MVKRTFRVALALISILAFSVACNKSDNPDVAGTITIDNSVLYEQLGITDDINKALSEAKYVITDSLLIYDNTGSLVTKFGVETGSLQPLVVNMPKLSKGSYTIVSWQAARSKTGKPGWKLSGENKLSTVSLNAPGTPIPLEMAVGYAAATFNGGQYINAIVGFNPIGSIVEYRVDGLSEADGYQTSFIWDPDEAFIVGLRLDPNLAEANRWIANTDTDDYNTICGINAGETIRKWFTLTHGENLQIYFSSLKDNTESTQYGYIVPKINAGDHLVCYFNYNRILWQPPFCGTQEALASWKADRDAGLLVDNPLLKWGCDFSDVQKHIEAKQWWKDGNEKMDYWGDEFCSWHKWYYVGSLLTEQYLFETEDGKNLRYVMTYLWDSGQSLDIINNSLLKKGYTYKGEAVLPLDGETYELFVSPDGKTDAWTVADDEEDVLFVLYTPHA